MLMSPEGILRVFPTDDSDSTLAESSKFNGLFSKVEADTLPPHLSVDHTFIFEKDVTLPKGCLYNLSETKLRVLKAYIDTYLPIGFIKCSTSPSVAPILLQRKTMEGYDYVLNIEHLIN